MAEHLLDRAEICSAFKQVWCKDTAEYEAKG